MNIQTKLCFDDILIVPRNSIVNSRKDVSLVKKFTFRGGRTWCGIPIVVSNMDSTGTFEMAKACGIYKLLTCIHKYYSVSDWKTFIQNESYNNKSILNYVAVSTGISNQDIKKLNDILTLSNLINVICVDVANGYIPNFLQVIESIRKKYPNKIIIAGNVVTPERCKELYTAGVDIIKIGIGSGSVCLTRKQTGIGYPQASAVNDCKSDFKHHIMSDGGCKNAGDVCKAFAMGADFVMLGSVFSGHIESAGEIVEENGNRFKLFYGMSSKHKMNKYDNGVNNYRSSEGKCVRVLVKGFVKNTITDLLGGLRSHISYIGFDSLQHYDYTKITKIKTTIQLNPIYN